MMFPFILVHHLQFNIMSLLDICTRSNCFRVLFIKIIYTLVFPFSRYFVYKYICYICKSKQVWYNGSYYGLSEKDIAGKVFFFS